jgi:hypothetical protein
MQADKKNIDQPDIKQDEQGISKLNLEDDPSKIRKDLPITNTGERKQNITSGYQNVGPGQFSVLEAGGPAGTFDKQPHYTQLQEPVSGGGKSGSYAAAVKDDLKYGRGGEEKIDREKGLGSISRDDASRWQNAPQTAATAERATGDIGGASGRPASGDKQLLDKNDEEQKQPRQGGVYSAGQRGTADSQRGSEEKSLKAERNIGSTPGWKDENLSEQNRQKFTELTGKESTGYTGRLSLEPHEKSHLADKEFPDPEELAKDPGSKKLSTREWKESQEKLRKEDIGKGDEPLKGDIGEGSGQRAAASSKGESSALG